MNLSNNRIRELTAIPQPRLSWVDLSQNKIETCTDFTGHDTLVELLMQKNRLETCVGLGNMPKLITLNLQGNKLTTLSDLKGLVCLKTLDVGKNKLTSLAKFPALPAMETFDCSENLIEQNGEKELENLSECASLKTLLMAGNPWVDEKADDFKKEVLIALDMLKIVQINDAEPVIAEDIQEAAAEK